MYSKGPKGEHSSGSNKIKGDSKGISISVNLPKLEFSIPGFTCPHCRGSGYQLAMRMRYNSKGKTERGSDTKVKCEFCSKGGE